MGEVRNIFQSGMVQDSFERLSSGETYRMARNAIHQSRESSNFGLVNEESNFLAASFGGTIKGYSHIEERNQTLFFVDSGASEIWLFNHDDNSKEFVCSDSEFGCNWGFDGCEFLYGEFKSFNKCTELHVYWSSDCVYHVVNIDEMLDEVRKSSVIQCEDCSYFDVFKATCGPHLSNFQLQNSGSTLEAGAYQFAVQFSDNDGNTTNVFDISQPVYIESEDNIGGQVSQNAIKLIIEGLDDNYDEVIIYVIKTINQVRVVQRLPGRPYGGNGMSFEYYGQEGQTVDIATVLNKSKAFLRGQDLIQKDGRMFFYNIKNERNLNYQKYANEIKVEYVEYETSMEMQMKYHFPSLMRGEVYAVGIVWRYNDGTYSPAFHVPGCRQGGGGGGQTGGGSVEPFSELDEAVQDFYKPVSVSDFNTTGQHERKRNPEDLVDRPNESDKLEDAIRTDINAIDTSEATVKDAADCLNCGPTDDAVDNDLSDVSNSEQNNANLLAGMGLDDGDPDVNTTNSLKDAALDLFDKAVREREYTTRSRPTLSYTGENKTVPNKPKENSDPLPPPQPTNFDQEGSGSFQVEEPGPVEFKSARGDNWVDSLGNDLVEEPIRRISVGETEPYVSEVDYPDAKDCDGEFFYPQGKVCHHRIPWSSEKPHFVSFQNGVQNQYQPENDPYSKTYTRPMGFRFSNIKFPEADELPKPLCPKSPFKIVYVKRDFHNKSVFAKGWCGGMFTGNTNGTTHFYPRHGVNSFERVDRMIADGDDGLSRLGARYDGGAYTFHSPDTDGDNSYLPINKVKSELALKGSGWRYGLYAQGRKPSNQWESGRKDQRGARVANNINHYDPGTEELIDVNALTYLGADSVVGPIVGSTYPVMNRFRESSVFFECASRLRGDDRDASFVGDVRDHFCPTTANAPYAALIREVKDQYGGVQGLQYIDLGLSAKVAQASGYGVIEGICGDVWIEPYSKRRTSYVSNKVGDIYNVPNKPGSPCRPKTICDSGEDKIFDYLGMDNYPGKLPESGDLYDPKNYAGLHTVEGSCGAFGLSKNCADAAAAGDSESDFYYPRTLKSLVHCVVESHINPALRETGVGSQIQTGQVYYPKLKDLYLDSSSPAEHPWEESFMNRFYCAVDQPSKKQLAKKAFIRNLLNIILPSGFLLSFQNLESVVDTSSLFLTFPLLSAFWVLAINTLFTNKRLNMMFGIGDCKRDEEGGDLDECIENFEDAYFRYNLDYSKVNDVDRYSAFSLPYNTCDCDSCDKDETTNEVFYSNKQNLDSEIDAYRNIQVNNYNEMPANAGKLRKLFIQGNGFYAHTTDGIWLLRLGVEQLADGVAFQLSGTGELLAEPQLLFEGVAEGFAGTDYPNAAINTGFGYFFIDDVANKIYRFNGSPEEITAYGMYHFFKENLGLCGDKGCRDERDSQGVGYALGWDPRYNRLLITKKDATDCDSFTASYTPMGIPTQGGGSRGKWLSFHDYKPEGYLWDRDNFYSVLHGKGEVWQHHKKGEYGTFYGQKHPFEVEFTATSPNLEAFSLEYLLLDTEAELNTSDKRPKKGVNETFNKVAIWNSTQGSGTLPIEFAANTSNAKDRITFDYSKVRYNRENRMWQANGFKDLILDNCRDNSLFSTQCDCQAIPDVNEEIFDCTVVKTQDFNNRIISDKWLSFRYTLDNRNDMRLHLVQHKVIDDTKIIAK